MLMFFLKRRNPLYFPYRPPKKTLNSVVLLLIFESNNILLYKWVCASSIFCYLLLRVPNVPFNTMSTLFYKTNFPASVIGIDLLDTK